MHSEAGPSTWSTHCPRTVCGPGLLVNCWSALLVGILLLLPCGCIRSYTEIKKKRKRKEKKERENAMLEFDCDTM